MIDWILTSLEVHFFGKISVRNSTVYLIPKRIRQILISYLAHNDTVCINTKFNDIGDEYIKPKNGELLITNHLYLLYHTHPKSKQTV